MGTTPIGGTGTAPAEAEELENCTGAAAPDDDAAAAIDRAPDLTLAMEAFIVRAELLETTDAASSSAFSAPDWDSVLRGRLLPFGGPAGAIAPEDASSVPRDRPRLAGTAIAAVALVTFVCLIARTSELMLRATDSN
jgi:hypothetical protein